MGMNSSAKLVYGIDLGQSDEDGYDHDEDDPGEIMYDNEISSEMHGCDEFRGWIATAGNGGKYPETKKECLFEVEWGSIQITLPQNEPATEEEKQELISQLDAAGIKHNSTFSWHLASLYY